jgi:hypothetical protein
MTESCKNRSLKFLNSVWESGQQNFDHRKLEAQQHSIVSSAFVTGGLVD